MKGQQLSRRGSRNEVPGHPAVDAPPRPWTPPRGGEPGTSNDSPPRTPETSTVAEKVEQERQDRLAELEAAREKLAAEKKAEPAVRRLYAWSAEQVATAFEELEFPECAKHVIKHNLEGWRFMNVTDSTLGDLLEPISKDSKAAKEINAHFIGIREAELSIAPKLSALVVTKIDASKRSCNLNLNQMNLTVFPDMVCNVPQLVNISAVHNKMKFVPSEVGLLTRLVNLKLGQNKILALPESLGRCKSLQMLMLEENELKQLPRSLGHCRALRVVDVSRNHLQSLPSTLSQCHKIVKIVAFDNPLKLPREVMDEGTKAVMDLLESIGNAEEGGYLRMYNIKLHAVPAFTFEMTALTMLNLDGNSIKSLDGLHVLTGLRSLSFAKNKVEHVPISFAALTNLSEFKCANNPIISPPEHVIALGPQVIVRYLAARANLLSENLHQAFSVFDDDNSGVVSRKEMSDGLEKVDLRVTKEDLIALIDEHDDGNGLIDFDEFKTIMLKLIRKRSAGSSLSRSILVDSSLPEDDEVGEIRDSSDLADEVLDLSDLGLTKYSIDLDEPARVTVLNLSHNRITDMPVMKKLKCLRSLIMDDNLFTQMPETIFQLPSLRRLSVNRCKLTWLPEVLFTYSALEELSLEGNQMQSLPCDLVRMTALQKLELGENPFKDPLMSISHEGMEYTMAYLRFFYNAREFGVLDLKDFGFAEMPFESDVRQVKEIQLSRNKFQVAPSLLMEAKMLTSLDMSENYLEKIPSGIWEALTNLKILRLSKNRLQALPRTIGELHRLEVFYCDENTLDDLPNTMSSLHGLKLLDLTHNRLHMLHVSVGGLTGIESLNLTRNRLVTLPAEIQGMVSLKSFIVRSNDMESIPDVWDCMNLTQLDLSRNPLKAVPLSLGALVTCMEEISIDRHLHLDDPPDNIVSRGTKPFLSYMQKQYLARKSRNLNLSGFHLAKVTVPLQQLNFHCSGLRTLDVSKNNIVELPRNLGVCASLEALLVSDNRLTGFPQSSKQLKTLTRLDAAGNSFDYVPDMLTYTPFIKILDLSRNNLQSLYRVVDDVTNAGFSDALTAGKRAKRQSKAVDFEGRRLRQIIETKVMDRIAAKVRSDNRSKQVGALFELLRLEKLNLASNRISLLPGTVARFTLLKELIVSHNELKSLPPDIGQLVRLRKVDFSHNNLIGIPEEIGNLGKCTSVDVSNNHLLALPNEIGSMTSLADLNFENNDVKFMPVTLESLETCLTKLNADGNQISDPPAEILGQGRDSVFTYFRRVRNGQKCRSLVLIDMKLEKMELNWSNLTVLTALELSGNNIRELPTSFTMLTNLVTLKAAGNSLDRVFAARDASPFSNLTRLAMKENHIAQIEPNIGDLVMLKDLDMSCNRIVKIAQEIENCTNIKRLILSQNQLDHIPRNVFRILLLENLDASSNCLRALPTAICYCKSLLQLKLSHNRIETLPRDIGNLEMLQHLDVGTNLLRALPPSIKHCERMEFLALNNNKLSFVPAEIRKLKRLKHLNIKDNNIISIPLEVKELQKLETLDMDGNIFLSAPSSLKELPNLKEIVINPSQASALFCGGKDITPVLNVKDLSEDRIVLNKVPRAHMLSGAESMSTYLDRIHQRESLPSLNLTHMKLTFLPKEVFALTSLTVLDVKENNLEFLPETVDWLSSLTHLDVSVNKLKRLPDATGRLTNLTTLGLARNEMEFLPASLMYLTALTFIDIHVNHLPTLLPEDEAHEWERIQNEAEAQAAFVDEKMRTPTTPATPATPSAPNTPSTPSRRLRRGRSLHADSANETEFSRILAYVQCPLPKGGVVLLTGLRDFECSYNGLDELPDMSKMFNLTRVNLAHNRLRDLPEVVCELVGLEKIECGDNRVRSVPKAVSKLTRLTLLSLKNNNLRTLPKELGQCLALKSLSLNANDLITIPDDLCLLTNLKRLTLAANNLQELPLSIGDNAALQMLDLASNPVIRLPPSLGMLHETLNKIELFECDQLIEPPAPILEAGHGRMMEYLRKLWRGFTTMRMVLTGLGMGRVEIDFHNPALRNLAELRLDKNELKTLPEAISELPVLLSLRFRENAVLNLHDCFTQLTSLKELDMSKNRFVNIPPCVLALTQLQRLRVTNNPIPYTMPNDWIEKDVGEWLQNYVRETIGKRISSMWTNNNLSEVLTAWRDITDELALERQMADD